MLSGIIASILMVLFLIGWIWAWSPRRNSEFKEAARLALEESADETGEERP